MVSALACGNKWIQVGTYTKDPDTSLSLKDPSFSHLIVKQVTIFGKKLDFSQIWWNVEKILAIFPESPYFWMHFTESPLFLCALSLKDPLFWHNLSSKDAYIWGAWWHSYITFICECPPPPRYKRWLAQNYFQIFKFVFSCLLSGEQSILSNDLKESIQMIFFQTINDELNLLIPIHSCSKWKTNWLISKKCSEAKIHRCHRGCHLQNQPYLEKCVCYKHDLGVILKLTLKWFTWY